MAIDAASLGTLAGFLGGVSLATERATEAIKNLVWWLADDKKDGMEHMRVFAIHLIAIIIATLITALSYEQVASMLGISDKAPSWGTCLVFGLLAAGGSSVWNSAQDILRERNKQNQMKTDEMKGTGSTAGTGGTRIAA